MTDDCDVLHDYRPDPTFVLESRLEPWVETSDDDSGIPAFARKAEGALAGFHHAYTHDALGDVELHEPADWAGLREDDEDLPAWKDMEREEQLAHIEDMELEALLNEADAFFEGFSFEGCAGDELDPSKHDKPAFRPYAVEIYRRCPDHFHLRELLLEGRDVRLANTADLVAEAPSPHAFAGLALFRAFYVNGMLAALKEKLSFTHRLVGKVELGGRYHVRLGGADDVAAAFELQRAFRSAWDHELQTVFDASVTVRAWLPVADQALAPSKGEGQDASVQIETLESVGDVYALVALQRAISPLEWNALVDATRRKVDVLDLENDYADDPAHTDFLHYDNHGSEIPRFARFDLAGLVYEAQFVAPLLLRLHDLYDRHADDEDLELLEPELEDPATLEALMRLEADAVRRAMNLAYLELGAKLRLLEQQARKANPGSYTWRQNTGAEVAEVDTGMSEAGFVELTETVSQLASEMCLFAPEEPATQGGAWSQAATAARATPEVLTVDHRLQSFNEQVAAALRELGDRRRALAKLPEAKEVSDDDALTYRPRVVRLTATGLERSAGFQLQMEKDVEAMAHAISEDPAIKARKTAYETVFPKIKRSPDAKDAGLLRLELTMVRFFDNALERLMELRAGGSDTTKLSAKEKDAAVLEALQEALDNTQFKQLAEEKKRRIGRIEYGSVHHEDDGREHEPDYDPDAEGDEWTVRHLAHHLLWHCAMVNKLVRKIRSRGPFEITVVNLAKA